MVSSPENTLAASLYIFLYCILERVYQLKIPPRMYTVRWHTGMGLRRM